MGYPRGLMVSVVCFAVLAFGGQARLAAQQEKAASGASGGAGEQAKPAAAPRLAAEQPKTKPERATDRLADQPMAPAGADHAPTKSAAPVAAPATGAAPSSQGTLNDLSHGPSLYETGRVGPMGVSGSGAKIKRTQDRAAPKELRVDGAAAAAGNEAAAGGLPEGGGGVINQSALARELRPRFTLLRDCRVQVARQKHIAATEVPAGRLILRWTILPNGQVNDTQVVALSPVDGHVVDCVKRAMSLWSFTPPVGGAAHVERPFKFQ